VVQDVINKLMSNWWVGISTISTISS
jgi:hypothetical protein